MADEFDGRNGQAALSRERFLEMKNGLDDDGDGSVTKEEFFIAYGKMFPDLTTKEIEQTWFMMDTDLSGTLEVEELAAFFGFNWDGDAATEMSDEQILEALALQSKMYEMKLLEEEKASDQKLKLNLSKLDGSQAGGETPLVTPRSVLPRDPTIRLIQLEQSGMGTPRNHKPAADEEDLKMMMTCCLLGDLVAADGQDEYLIKYLDEKKCIVRVEDEKGEMPLHKLARLKVSDKRKAAFQGCFEKIIMAMRQEVKAAGKKGIGPDVNHQDKAGKTPLFMAVEHKNIFMIDLLYSLDKDGPDTLLVNAAGWTIMHAAVNTDDLKVVREVTKHFTPARTKLLLKTPDKTGREPLHIAAYRCTEEMVGFLLDLGATNKKHDTGGNTPSKLADRSGRRKSKDIIDERTGGGAEELGKKKKANGAAAATTAATAVAASNPTAATTTATNATTGSAPSPAAEKK